MYALCGSAVICSILYKVGWTRASCHLAPGSILQIIASQICCWFCLLPIHLQITPQKIFLFAGSVTEATDLPNAAFIHDRSMVFVHPQSGLEGRNSCQSLMTPVIAEHYRWLRSRLPAVNVPCTIYKTCPSGCALKNAWKNIGDFMERCHRNIGPLTLCRSDKVGLMNTTVLQFCIVRICNLAHMKIKAPVLYLHTKALVNEGAPGVLLPRKTLILYSDEK